MFTPDYLSRLPSTSFKVIENEVKSEDIPDRVFALYHLPQSNLNDKDAHRELYLRTLVDPKNQPSVAKKDTIITFGEVELSSSSLKAAQEKDDWCRNILFMLKNKNKNKTAEKFSLIDDVLHSTEREVNRPVITEPHASEFISYVHTSYGHPGTYATMKLVSKYVYINKLKESAASVCSKCIDCLQSKPRAATRPAMIPVRHYPDAPWTYSAVDLYDLGKADINRKRYLLTIVDHLTGFLDGIPIANKNDRTVANGMNELLLRHGLTGRCLLDNGKEFGSLFCGLLRRFNIQIIRTSSYNSRSNGKLERCHRSITEKLKLLNAKRTEWSFHWPYVKFLINNLPKSNLDGLSACEALYGRSMFAPLADIRHAQPEPCPEGFIKALNHYISELHPSLMAHHYAKYERDLKKDNGKVIQLKKGTKVLLYKPNIEEGKLSRVWSGPYVVERNYSQNSYVIKNPETGQTYTRHLRLLRVLHDQPTPTPEDIISDDEEEPDTSENENHALLLIFGENFGPSLL
jgi:transposase InsO family protein